MGLTIKEGGEGLETAAIGIYVSPFSYISVPLLSKLNIQNYPLVEVSGYT